MPGLSTLALLATLAPAAAAERWALATGAQVYVNDPFVTQWGLHANLERRIDPGFALGLGGALYVDQGDGDFHALTTHLDNTNHILPDISRLRWRAELCTRWAPFEVTTERMTGRAGLHTGFGLARTVDDLEALQQEDDPYAQATERQLHPTMVWGLHTEMGRERMRLRLRLERMAFVETVSSTTLETRSYLMLAGELVLLSP